MTVLTGTLSEILIYPIKSCASVQVASAQVTQLGLQGDRRWLIVDDQGMFQTQRQIPHLTWIEPILGQSTLTLRAPSQPEVVLALACEGFAHRTITVWRDTIAAYDMGDEAAHWLDEFLQVPGRHFRLVQFDPAHARLCDVLWTGDGKASSNHPFTDGFGLNVLSLAALDELNQRLEQAELDPVSAPRFRPNLVIDGVDAHEEDNMASMHIETAQGTIVLELVKPCTRCQVPEIDPYTAMREPRISDVLAEYRRMNRMNNAICFGVNAVVRQGAGLTLEPGPFKYELRF